MIKGAVFLDRDGVLNRERGAHTWRVEDFEVLPEVAEGLLAIHKAGLLAIVITNQSGIALGMYDHADVANVHAYLHRQLASHGVALDAVYYCPHHPDKGRCLCRKPAGFLFERAIARYAIDASRSVMIGDKQRDIDAAASAGVRGILVPSNGMLLSTLMNQAIL